MHPAIAQHRASIAAICQRYGIRRLEVFGSAARGDDFVPESRCMQRDPRAFLWDVREAAQAMRDELSN